MIGLSVGNIVAGEPYMLPYKETMLLFVHGVNSDRYTWFEPTEKGLIKEDGDTNKWIHYINRELGVHEKLLKRYSFSRSSGYHEVNMLEFGNGGYRNKASEPDAENNKGELQLANGTKIPKSTGIADNQSWLEQAKAEYKQALFDDPKINPRNTINEIWRNIYDVPDALLPAKLVLVGHSQANYAIRGYIQSGALAREGYFDYAVDKGVVPEYLVSKIKDSPLGFYEWPVEKVVFINPPLKGSDMAWVLVYRVVQVLQRIMDPKAFEIGKTTGSGVVGDLTMLTALMVNPKDSLVVALAEGPPPGPLKGENFLFEGSSAFAKATADSPSSSPATILPNGSQIMPNRGSDNGIDGIELVGTVDFEQKTANVRNLNRLEASATLNTWAEGRYNVTAKATVLNFVKKSIENLTLHCV